MIKKALGIKDQAENGEIESDWLGLFTEVRLGSIVHHCIAVFISLLTFQMIHWPYMLDRQSPNGRPGGWAFNF